MFGFPKTFIGIAFVLLSASTEALFPQSFVLRSRTSGFDGVGLVGGTNGVAVADYDQDGDLDIYFVVQASFNQGDIRTWNRLFSNNGNGTFRDVTSQAGVAGHDSSSVFSYMGYKMGASWGDYDNDGYPDLYLTNVGPNQLLHNNRNGTFTDVTARAGVAVGANKLSSSSLWFDYDNDGDLDLYVSVWADYSSGTRETKKRMFENLGGGLFRDVSEASGLANPGLTWSSVTIDANNDGYRDLFLANDFGFTELYVNNRDKTFLNKSTEFGLRYAAEGMGLAIADCDRNGFFDIYLTNVTETGSDHRNPLFLNMGNSRFTDKAVEAGVSLAGWAWGTDFLDYDNDGDDDLFVGNGYFAQVFANRFFRNDSDSGNVRFREISRDVGLADTAEARGVAVFDYNNDGRQDLLVSSFTNEPSRIVLPLLYENTGGAGNWLKFKLEGTTSNRDAFGAVVEVWVNGKSYKKYHHGAQFLGQSITPVHFGLGGATRADSIIVRWPSGNVDRIGATNVNQTIRIKERSTQTKTTLPPDGLALLNNYPNPFNGSTKICFILGVAGEVEMTVFSPLGQRLYVAREVFSDVGEKTIPWAAVDTDSKPVATGVYFYKVRASNGIAKIGRMVFIK